MSIKIAYEQAYYGSEFRSYRTETYRGDQQELFIDFIKNTYSVLGIEPYIMPNGYPEYHFDSSTSADGPFILTQHLVIVEGTKEYPGIFYPCVDNRFGRVTTTAGGHIQNMNDNLFREAEEELICLNTYKKGLPTFDNLNVAELCAVSSTYWFPYGIVVSKGPTYNYISFGSVLALGYYWDLIGLQHVEQTKLAISATPDTLFHRCIELRLNQNNNLKGFLQWYGSN